MKCNIICDTNGHSKHLELKLFEAEEIIDQCLSQCRANEVFMSFNGGKDCTVLLHVLDRVYKNKYGVEAPPITCMYVRPDDPFQEIEDFIQQCQRDYNINVITFSTTLKLALNSLLEQNNELKACFMGSRRTDPHCDNLQTLQMTDPGWPKILRVNPILNWNLADVWDYIMKCKVPYCSLYDRGYTSLGSRSNTQPNPHLKYLTNEGTTDYRPAYCLKDFDKFERDGRL